VSLILGHGVYIWVAARPLQQCSQHAISRCLSSVPVFIHIIIKTISVAWITKVHNKMSDNKVRIRMLKKEKSWDAAEKSWATVMRWGVPGGYPQISGENWEGPTADGSEVEGWHNHLVRVRWPESQSRWHISDAGEVGQQIRGCTAVHCSVAKYRDFEQDALWNAEPQICTIC